MTPPRSRDDRRRILAAQHRPEAAPAGRSGGFPARITHDELDELARRHRVTFAEGASKADKVAALEAAGVRPG